MGGVDHGDHMLTTYGVERKRVKKWYKKFFMDLISTAAFNGKLGNNITSLQFRTEIIEYIFSTYAVPREVKRKGRPSKSADPLRLIERHFPSYIPSVLPRM